MKTITFDQAKNKYIHRYTMEYVPAWAGKPCEGNGKYYAPQFKNDAEWYENTDFPPHPNCFKNDCHVSGLTWPLGHWLDAPFKKGQS